MDEVAKIIIENVRLSFPKSRFLSGNDEKFKLTKQSNYGMPLFEISTII